MPFMTGDRQQEIGDQIGHHLDHEAWRFFQMRRSTLDGGFHQPRNVSLLPV
jgi:hypothetical protein